MNAIEQLEKQLKEVHPSWSNANITAKAVRMHFLKEEDELLNLKNENDLNSLENQSAEC